MKDINNVNLVGRLVKDGELTYLQSGSAVLNITIASNTSQKTNNEWKDYANYFDAVLFGKPAENLNKFCKKGQQIAICGTLKQERWEKDGKKGSRIRILVNDLQLLGGKHESTGNNSSNAPASVNELADAVGGEVVEAGNFPEDIPF